MRPLFVHPRFSFQIVLVLAAGCSPPVGAPASVAAADSGAVVSAAPAGATTAPIVASAAASASAPQRETVGGLEQGTSAADAERLLGKPTSKSTPTLAEASGTFLSEWGFGDGVSAMMEGATREGPFEVKLLSVRSPSKLKTSRGVAIGSTRAEVEAAYGSAIDRAQSTPEFVLVGERFGGLKFALDKDAKVRSISIGSDGE